MNGSASASRRALGSGSTVPSRAMCGCPSRWAARWRTRRRCGWPPPRSWWSSGASAGAEAPRTFVAGAQLWRGGRSEGNAGAGDGAVGRSARPRSLSQEVSAVTALAGLGSSPRRRTGTGSGGLRSDVAGSAACLRPPRRLTQLLVVVSVATGAGYGLRLGAFSSGSRPVWMLMRWPSSPPTPPWPRPSCSAASASAGTGARSPSAGVVRGGEVEHPPAGGLVARGVVVGVGGAGTWRRWTRP